MQILSIIVFFITSCIVFPFALDNLNTISIVAYPAVWVVSIFAIHIATHTLFQEERTNGIIDMWVQLSPSMYLIAISYVISLFCVYGLAIIAVLPVVSLLFGIPANIVVFLALSLLTTLPGLFAVYSFTNTLTSCVKNGAVLSTIITLPFAIPFIIFGAGAIKNLTLGLNVIYPLLLAGGLSIIALLLCPLGISYLLRLQASE